MQSVFDFGIDCFFPESDLSKDGKIIPASKKGLAVHPYFVRSDEARPDEPDASHYLARKFPGHSLNHYFLFWLQPVPIQVARSFAYFHLSGKEEYPEVTFVPAQAESVNELIDAVREFIPFYEGLIGRRRADAFKNNCLRLVDEERIFSQVSMQESTGPARPDEIEPAIVAQLDETYLHLTFFQNAFEALLDELLLTHLDMDKARLIDERFYRNPIFKRLQGKGTAAKMKFLSRWERQSYRLPVYAKKFIRSFRRIKIIRQ